ncbi:hypothetical protein SUGI_0420580 [Cryptomeria japonica]|nr:hypothetical protein SUGI_0420580 [Cryptomeria japonica]
MKLKDMDCWDKEETELGLKLCCPPVKRRRRDSCSLDLFNGSSCETVVGITKSLGNRDNSSSVSADPAGELKEQDLIRCLMKSCSSSKDNRSASFCSGVDCTLSLGMPHNGLCPREQNPMEMLRQRTMQGSFIEKMQSKILSPKIKDSDLEASYNKAAPFSGLYNISSVNNVYRSHLYKSHRDTTANAATTSYPIAWFPIAHTGSKFMDSKDILAHRSYATDLGSELLHTRPKKGDRNPMNNSNGSSIRIVQQKQRSNITSHDPARRCSACHTTTTPLWRNGPKGAKSLCNACGIRYKKEERRVASAMAAAAESKNQFVNHNNKIATS